MPQTTWKPSTRHGELDTDDRESLPDSTYAFPKQRKEPLTDARHVQNALARFDQVQDVSDTDRDAAFATSRKPLDTTGYRSKKAVGASWAGGRILGIHCHS
jgi:hypothetical protein